MQHPHPDRPPHEERRHDHDSERTKRDDRLNDQRTHNRHPDDDRLTEADLDQHQRERRSTHARTRNAS